MPPPRRKLAFAFAVRYNSLAKGIATLSSPGGSTMQITAELNSRGPTLVADNGSAANLATVNRFARQHQIAANASPEPIIAIIRSMSNSIEGCDEIAELQRGLPAADYLQDLLRQSSASLVNLNEAAAVRLRIMRKIGLQLMELNLRGGDRKSKSQGESLKLKDLNLKKDFASRCRKIASLSGNLFDAAIGSAIQSEHELTATLFYRLAEAEKRRNDPSCGDRSKETEATTPACDLSPATQETELLQTDLRSIPDGFRLVSEDDYDELEGSIGVLSQLLSDALVDSMLLKNNGKECYVGVTQIPRYIRQLQEALSRIVKLEQR